MTTKRRGAVTLDKLKTELQRWAEEHGLAEPDGLIFWTAHEWEYGVCDDYVPCKDALLHCDLGASGACGLREVVGMAYRGISDTADAIGDALHEELVEFVDGLGYWWELGFSWSMHFYQDDGANEPEAVLLPFPGSRP